MKRYIDANALKEHIAEHVYPVHDDFNSLDYGMFWTGGIERCIDEIPTADVKEILRGTWIRQHDTRFGPKLNDIIICSVCGTAFSSEDLIRRSFCPNCGADMRDKK